MVPDNNKIKKNIFFNILYYSFHLNVYIFQQQTEVAADFILLVIKSI